MHGKDDDNRIDCSLAVVDGTVNSILEQFATISGGGKVDAGASF